ncbi:hypothetical protein SH2C18_45970 [Clostridium sediminicola]|uniref:hypothetical protein n=1 Tax=Clostridium sediminicola TaxID=3114879 RepID=UPI0031F27FF1
MKNKILRAFVTFVGFIGAMIITLILFMLIDKLQGLIFAPDEYLLYMFKPPYSYLVFFFQIEMMMFIIYTFYKNNKYSEFKWVSNIFNYIKKKILIVIGINLFIFYMCITGVTVVTQDKIVDYSFYKPAGMIYSYDDILKIETGFKGKTSGVFRRNRNAGDFYYVTNFKDGTKVDFYQASSPYEDTYLELEIFDDLITKSDVEKISSADNSQYCNLDQRYIDRFLRIISNR